jgi:DNA primase
MVVEGYTDVLMAHQHGVETVVAALGTSLTTEHAKVLRRYAERIVLVFDSDVAGRAAANRALEVCLTGKVDIRLAFVPEGKDPCDFVLESGPAAFEAVVDAAEDVLSFKWKHLTAELTEQDSLGGRTEAVQQFLKVVAMATQAGQGDSLGLAMLVGRLSALLQTPKSRIDETLQKLLKQKSPVGRPHEQTTAAASTTTPAQSAMLKARREILEVLMLEPGLYASVFERLRRDDFGDGPLREVADALIELLDAGRQPELAMLYRRVESTEAAALLTEIDAAGSAKGDRAKRLEDSLRQLHQQRSRQDIEDYKQRLTDDSTDELRHLHGRLKQEKNNLRRAGLL